MKTRYFLGIAAILLAAPFIVTAGDPVGSEDRECYGSELAPGVPVFLCMFAGTQSMDKSFLTYSPMNAYYTPQLKEIDLTGGATQTLSGGSKKKTSATAGTLTITGGPSYMYVKHLP
jgi:hypothetical protein